MSFPIPPELMGVPAPTAPQPGIPTNPGMPPGMPPGAVPNPPMPMPTDPMAAMMGQAPPPMQPTDAIMGMLTMPMPGNVDPASPAPPQMAGDPGMGLGMPPMPGSQDPVLDSLLAVGMVDPLNPEDVIPDNKKKGYRPQPDDGFIDEVVLSDKRKHEALLLRFARDIGLYRQKLSAKPPIFDPKREVAFKSATLPNVINKLTNMSSAADFQYIVPFKDEQTKKASQIIENFHDYNRSMEILAYAENGGGSLQYDEFFYLYLYGRVCYRILPDPEDEEFPYHVSLLDPSTVFPTFAGDKGSLVRVSRIYQARTVDVIETYSRVVPDIRQRMIAKLGMDEVEYARSLDQEGEVREYWDTWWRSVSFKGVQILKVPHKLGYVPFVYVVARGEPRSVVTPEGGYPVRLDEYNNAIQPVSAVEDMAEKGVSVFHHIVQTNMMTEVVYTLLISEVLKAQNPATVTYSTPQLGGDPPPPLRTHPGANNQRILNAQKVEAIPTSPRPTDTSPVLNKLAQDTTEGSINGAMFGNQDGSNIAGFAIESLISAARDAILPYHQAFEKAQAMKAKMMLTQYRDFVLPITTLSVPMDGKGGSTPAAEVDADVIRLAGLKVSVEMMGISDQALPGMVNAATSAVREGFWSRRRAMEKLGEKDPDRMLREIIAERALEHPEMMENFVIPMGFIQNGQYEFAKLWTMMVVMPKIQQMAMSMSGGAMPGMPGMPPPGGPGASPAGGPPGGMPGMPPELQALMSGGGSPPAPQGQNGMSNPMMARDRGAPTGPLPGQGRGAASE